MGIIATPASRRRANPVQGDSVTSAKGKRKKKPAAADASENEKIIARNRKARHDYLVLDTLECGLVLAGSEVKSLRAGRASLDDAYARLQNEELWMLGCNIQEYVEANRFNHEPKRPRKLLVHRREIRKFAAPAMQKGLTLVPLKMYFKRGRAKVLLGLCRGKREHDKRETLKRTEARREIQHAMRRR